MRNSTQSGGLVESVRRVARTIANIGRNRLDLFVLELQEERVRATQVVILAGVIFILGLIGVILLTGVVIFLFPERFRIYAAAGLGVLCLLGAAWALTRVKTRLQEPPFSDTLGEFKKDLESLSDDDG